MFGTLAGLPRCDRTTFVIATCVAVLALPACGAATESQGPPAVKTPGGIVALIDSPRLTSLSLSGDVVTAEGQVRKTPGDDLRTYWFTTVGALAHIRELGGSVIARKILHGTTLVDPEGYAGEEAVGTLADPATYLSEEDLNARTLRWAEAVDVVVEELNYVPFLGGAAELVLRPRDELKFMRNLDMALYELFSALPQEEERPFLFTIVDGSGAARRVWGFFSLGAERHVRQSDGTKMTAGGGEGFAWQADDLSEALGVDASGRPLEGPQPVQNMPEPSVADLSRSYERLCRAVGIDGVAKMFESASTAEEAARALAEKEPDGPRRDAIYEGCLRGLSG
jgi:hypothetical protein